MNRKPLSTWSVTLMALSLAALLALAACGQPASAPGDTGDEAGVADAGGDTGDGDSALNDGCIPGTLGCDCDDEALCSEGECVTGICEDCVGGALGCACDDDGHCEVGGLCGIDDLCVECEGGELGCPCDDAESCDDGLACDDGLCGPDDCVAGAEACPCDDDACDDGLGCHVDEFCYACDADAVGCECDETDGCANDLVCDATTLECREATACADVTCLENQLCDEGLASDDAACIEDCAEGFAWDGDGCVTETNCLADANPNSRLDFCTAFNRACVVTDGLADCGDCVTGFTDDDGNCRAVATCDALGCEPLMRSCTAAGAHTDAACGDCQTPFAEDADSGLCEVADDATCADDGSAMSILPICAPQHRYCVDPVDAPPYCGDCTSGYSTPTGSDVCLEESFCATLGCAEMGRQCDANEEPFASCGGCVVGTLPDDPNDPSSGCHEPVDCLRLDCGDDEFCIDSDTGGDAVCVANPCDEGQVFDVDANECMSCSRTCGTLEGETGRVWPYAATIAGTSCICETEPGYYIDPAAAFLVRPCDADGDGWVRVSARGRNLHPDPEIRANWHCDLRSIDRFTLQNELGQRLELLLCEDEDPVALHDGDESCTLGPAPLDLFESVDLDDNEQIAAETSFFPPYRQGGVGRQLRAEELNPLTKACVGDRGDFNDNQLADVSEAHFMEPPIPLAADTAVFLDFSYFVELHRGWYERFPGQLYGTWVIAERSRCDDETATVPFPLGYNDGGDYWRECTRNRAADYDLSEPVPGFDFARWSCDAFAGSCDELAPPTDEPPSSTQPEHGLCHVPPLSPDEPWRGMSHHSQFQCVVVTPGPATEPYQLSASALYSATQNPNGRYTQNSCRVACPAADPTCATDCDGDACATSSEPPAGAVDPTSPVLHCDQPTTIPTATKTMFVATRYLDAQDGTAYQYEAGCIDEWQTWPDLCPGYSPDVAGAAIGDGASTNFGELICGCGEHYGGPGCSLGCPGSAISADYDAAPRTGMWMCGGTQASAVDVTTDFDDTEGASLFGDSASDGRYVLQGSVAVTPVVRDTLCEADGCDTGFVLR